jgi:hypothetical protein
MKDGNLWQVFWPYVPEIRKHFDGVHQIGLLSSRRLKIMRVDTNRTQRVVNCGRCKRGGRRVLPEAAAGWRTVGWRVEARWNCVRKTDCDRRILQLESANDLRRYPSILFDHLIPQSPF